MTGWAQLNIFADTVVNEMVVKFFVYEKICYR